ncbi:acyl-CoA thioesterase [Rhodococcus opacus]|uniref:acyl-CoA thioesterase n=1 Tax=Rhodococcus opacus TaxID=37919 RepID=UPI001C491DFF|nr:acyl-CoA thioesterase domain-containing protein [Rhodococcus opacus]MBV6756231.1 thioesterase family protein [Rhodococcus opacus]
MSSAPAVARDSDPVTIPLTALLALDRIDNGLFRSEHVFEIDRPLYGGQVIAQALMACGLTVDEGRDPHSLHGYFLRRGDATRPVIYRVENDRDGRSYSARRVVAIQNGAVILNMSCSFRTVTPGAERTASTVESLVHPDQCRRITADPGISIEARVQDWPTAAQYFPAKFWVRPNCILPDGDSLTHAAAIAYMTDFSAGLSRVNGSEILGPSLDHAVWFHRPPLWSDWLLVDYGAGVAAGKRGWYPGSVVDGNGEVVASMAQEMVYRDKR